VSQSFGYIPKRKLDFLKVFPEEGLWEERASVKTYSHEVPEV
jgi:hypothetical protein